MEQILNGVIMANYKYNLTWTSQNQTGLLKYSLK
jgi:hypothetical protein